MQQTNYVLGVWIFPLVDIPLEKLGLLVTDNQSAEKEDINSNIYYWFLLFTSSSLLLDHSDFVLSCDAAKCTNWGEVEAYSYPRHGISGSGNLLDSI